MEVTTQSVYATARLSASDMATVQRQAIFECCKWDHQVGDVAALADFALVISPECWAYLASTAESLYQETLSAESEIAADAGLISLLALPRKLETVLLANSRKPPSVDKPLRVMRFDFHPTSEGWRVSEVNSDVPGGYVEAAGFRALMARQYRDCALSADPVAALVSSLRELNLSSGLIGLIHATAYTDDRQVMVYLQRALQREGIETRLLSPADLAWANGRAFSNGEVLDALFRFFPAEWLPNLPGTSWKNYFQCTLTVQINPGAAAISQSKRFPLTWPHLRRAPEQWMSLMPETVAWHSGLDHGWVCKPTFGRVGDGVGLHGATTDLEWKAIRLARAKRPCEWVAQRRFNAVATSTTNGEVHPCLGVYVIEGRAAGIYGRIAQRPLIDHLAQDIAVLITPDPQADIRHLRIA